VITGLAEDTTATASLSATQINAILQMITTR